ncbi:MAG: hypothetical protein ACI93P_000297 [bacterium]|jgi:hypothetical protein
MMHDLMYVEISFTLKKKYFNNNVRLFSKIWCEFYEF